MNPITAFKYIKNNQINEVEWSTDKLATTFNWKTRKKFW